MSRPEFVYVTFIETTAEQLWDALTNREFTRKLGQFLPCPELDYEYQVLPFTEAELREFGYCRASHPLDDARPRREYAKPEHLIGGLRERRRMDREGSQH